MNKLLNAIINIHSIENHEMNESYIHSLHPLLKLICCFIIIIFTLTSYHITELTVYIILLFIICIFAKISIIKTIKRSLIGLPLCLCLGISYLIFNKNTINYYGILINEGLLLFIFILLKTFITLSFTYILMTTTSFNKLASELVHIKVPAVFVLQLTITYRYIFMLLHDAKIMSQSYLLRSPQSKAIEMKDVSQFIGHLLIKSMNDSLAVYNAMKCRGFNIKTSYNQYSQFDIENIFILMMFISLMIIIKVVCL